MSPRWILAATLGLASVTCTRSRPADPAPTPTAPAQTTAAPAPPSVHLTGCGDVSPRTLACTIAPTGAELRLWVDTEATPVVTFERPGGTAPKVVENAAAGGYSIRADARPDDGALRIDVAGAAPWRLTLHAAPATPLVDEVLAEVIAATGDRPQAYARAETRLREALDDLGPYERAEALRLQMKLLLLMGDADAAAEVGMRGLEAALDDERAGAAIDLAQMLVHIYIERGDEATWRWLVDLQTLYLHQVLDHGRQAQREYYAGSLAQNAGDLREAQRAFEVAELESRRLGLVEHELSAASLRAGLLGVLGRHEEQAKLVARVIDLAEPADDATDAERCTAAAALSNSAWAVLMASSPTNASPEAARLLELALASYGPRGACDVREHMDHRKYRDDAAITYALEASWRGDLPEAARRLDRVDTEALAAGQRAWVGYVQAAIAFGSGDGRGALRLLADARAHLREGTNLDPLLAWRLAMLEGDVYESRGEAAPTIAALRRAEEEVDAAVARVGLDQGREGLVSGLGRSATILIETYLKAGDVAEALAVARRSRGRGFRPLGGQGRLAALTPADRRRWRDHIDAYRRASEHLGQELSEAWKLPDDERERMRRRHQTERGQMREQLGAAYAVLTAAEARTPRPLAPPPASTAWLLYHPGTEGWIGFSVGPAGGPTAVPLGEIDPKASVEELGHALLDPFAAHLAGATSATILPMNELLGIEFAALPIEDRPLVDVMPVLYSADLPAVELDGPSRHTALLVGDPATRGGLGRLPYARAEAESAAASLRTAGWDVVLLVDREATHEALLRSLDGAGLFHYAGHGEGGADGWAFHLPLVGEASLEVGDVLAVPRGPGRVVLSGCDTGRIDERYGSGGIHLAAAFLLSGSQLVVAASDLVPDATAAAFSEALYADAGEVVASAEDFRRAQRATRTSDPDHWTLFRAWVP
jgi:tetratricopeptide (TPR) repeat protein